MKKIEAVGAVGAVAGAIVMLSRMAIAFITRARHGGHTGVVVAHEARHRGEVKRVRTRTIVGTMARGAVGGHLPCALNDTKAAELLSKHYVLRTVNGGHAERFCVGVLEIIETSKRVLGEARDCSVSEVRALEGVQELAPSRRDLPLQMSLGCHLPVPRTKLSQWVVY